MEDKHTLIMEIVEWVLGEVESGEGSIELVYGRYNISHNKWTSNWSVRYDPRIDRFDFCADESLPFPIKKDIRVLGIRTYLHPSERMKRIVNDYQILNDLK